MESAVPGISVGGVGSLRDLSCVMASPNLKLHGVSLNNADGIWIVHQTSAVYYAGNWSIGRRRKDGIVAQNGCIVQAFDLAGIQGASPHSSIVQLTVEKIPKRRHIAVWEKAEI